MKKTFILLTLVLMTMFVVGASKKSSILSMPSSYSGIITNNGIIFTNAPTVTNLLVAAEASTTNSYVSNIVVPVPATSAVLSVAIVGTNANFTNGVGFTTEKSYDTYVWDAMTNFVLTGNVATNVMTNIAVTLGDYGYVRLRAVTNANASTAFGRFEVLNK